MRQEPLILNNRYRLEQRLGTGGMATVYRAHDLTLERTVAIKILRQDYSNDPAFRERFHQEAKAAANLSHPNIVTVHDFGLYASQLFIVMEYVPGIDLKSLLRQRTRFTIPEAIELIVQACSGIGHAHRAGLVHCDVKPQNLLVTPDRRLKVLDFGIARALSTISPDEQSDIVWGSPQYFSPEQAAGNAPSPASDVYSLGIVLYEMLTGRLPFIATTAEELAQQHRETLPPSPSKFNPAIPLSLETIVLKVLSKEPAARYRTADQLGHVLNHFVQPPVAPSPPAIQYSQPVEAGPAVVPPVAYSSPMRAPAVQQPVPSPAYDEEPAYDEDASPDLVVIRPLARSAGFDWLTWLLALLALIAVGGLIPFWLWVFYLINAPV
jgi:eukaryotic-like serine/threonine-protein kinase